VTTGRGASVSDDGDSKQRILDAALELMSEKGYSGTSISMICQQSGLPPSSMYWYFRSKEGLLAAVIAYGVRTWLEGLPRWQHLEGEPRQRFRALLDAAARSLAENPKAQRLLMLLALERRGSTDSGLLDAVRDARHAASGGFRLAFREIYGTDTPESQKLSEDLADFALALADGALLAYEIDQSTDLPRMFGYLGDAFLALGDAAAPDRALD
jgi:AcrR family transcriptional regulator